MRVGLRRCAESARTTGLILMASGLVPMTSLISAKRSTPPSSAGGDCPDYSVISTEIIGVRLDLHPDRRSRQYVICEPVLLAIGDRGFLAVKVDPHLRVGVARAVPTGERVGTLRFLTLEFQQPAAGVGFAGLRRLA